MKKIIRTTSFLAMLSLCVLSITATAHAETAQPVQEKVGKKPVIIIRFNQPSVKYKHALKQVVEKAQEVKPDVRFELISIIPVFEEAEKNEVSRKIAEYNAAKVSEAMQTFNVEEDHIHISYQKKASVHMNEVRIVAY